MSITKSVLKTQSFTVRRINILCEIWLKKFNFLAIKAGLLMITNYAVLLIHKL